MPWRTRSILAACAVGLALEAWAYRSVLDNWFLGDDIAWLAKAADAGSLWRMIFSTPWDGYFRPVFHAVVWAEWKLFHTACLPYRIVSLALHGACALALGVIVQRLRRNDLEALCSVWVFLLLAAGSEAVYWISAQTVLLATAFGELTIIASLGYDSHRKWWYGAATVAFYALAVGASVAAAPVMLVVMFTAKARRTRLMVLLLILVTGAAVVAQAAVDPELTRQANRGTSLGDVMSIPITTWVDQYARVLPMLPWALGASLVAVSFIVLIRPQPSAAALQWLMVLSFASYMPSFARHVQRGSTLPFDRYSYGARPIVAFLCGAVAVALLALIERHTKRKTIRVVAGSGLLMLLVASQSDGWARFDLTYGEPSHRLSAVVRDITRLDPGPPTQLVLSDLAIPECWLVPSVSRVFFGRRLRCRPPRPGDMHLWRDWEGRLQATFMAPG